MKRTSRASGTIGDWLASQHDARFVGRSAELARFRGIIRGELDRNVIFVHGPGGSGKTALLRAMQRAVDNICGLRTHWVHDVPTVLAILSSNQDEMPTASDSVIFLDSFEGSRSSAESLRRDLLGVMPADAVLVIASRRPPDLGWRKSGWEHLTSEFRLSGLSRAESSLLLGKLGLPDDVVEDVSAWAAGSPLSLVMAADSYLTRGVLPPDADVSRTVMAIVGEGELDPAFDDAVHVCAIARATTRSLLSEILAADANTAFDWLAGRSFIESTGGALAPHPLVRGPLQHMVAAARPEQDRKLRRLICDHHYRKALTGDHLAVPDLAHLVLSPTVRWGYRLDNAVSYTATAVRAGDEAVVGAQLHERGYVDWWAMSGLYYRLAPSNVIIARSNDDVPVGHVIGVLPSAVSEGLLVDDQIGADCAAYAHRSGITGSALVWRDTIDLTRESGTSEGGVCSLLNISLVLRTEAPGLRHALVVVFDQSRRTHAFCQEVGGRLVPELRWTVDGREVRCYHIDWGLGGVIAAQRDLIYRELQVLWPARDLTPADVRDALESFHRDDVLSTWPLASGATPAARAESVRALLRSAVAAALSGTPHSTQLNAIVSRRFFTQREAHETIARSLALSRATYFRRLRDAIERITRYLVDRVE
ncbi:hypothetical protein [Actinokineospora sp. HUAS TT18]|uniref:Rab family GTPase n=1 Tax=Actinokineospora sp. HUAS TT18 TaxID=3447451 RepID=UPI003F51B17F